MKKAPTPRLVCNITGRDRITTREYLDARLIDLGINEETYLANYVCKDAMKLLRKGTTIENIRKELKSDKTHPISAEDIKLMLTYNGKQRGASAGPVISPREAAHLEAQAKAKAPAATAPAAAADKTVTVKPGAATAAPAAAAKK